MTNLSLQEVLELLDAQNASVEERHLERLRKWVESLVEARGKDYVLENRRELLAQWRQHSEGKFKACL